MESQPGTTRTDATITVKPSQQQMSREDQKRRDTFKMAYFTEIGAISRPIDIYEFHDLAVCAGIDIDEDAIQESWPLDKEEIEMDEAYHLFTRLPNIELRVKYQLENHKKITGTEELPFDSLIMHAQKKANFKSEGKRQKFLQMLERWKADKVTAQEALKRFAETKESLRNMNKALSDRARHLQSSLSSNESGRKNERNAGDNDGDEEITKKATSIPVLDASLSDSNNDYESSVFYDDHLPQIPTINHDGNSLLSENGEEFLEFDGIEMGKHFSHDTLSLSLAQRSMVSDQHHSHQQSSSRASSNIEQEQHLLKTVTKSIALQKSDGKNHSVGHVFTFKEVRNLRIEVRINDKIESELHRFENAIYGILTRTDTEKIIALTNRKKGNKISTEKLTLLPGTYLFVINFCRRIPDSIPRRRYAIKDPATGKLTSQYRLYAMNIFDMFDLNDDQVLDFREFSLYNIFSGGGNFVEEEWKALMENFDHRDNGLTLKAFVEMHHMEAESYETDDLRDMWLSVAELGFDEGFEPSKCCPVFIDYFLSDDEIFIEKYDTEHWKRIGIQEEKMSEWFWYNGSTLPYLKDTALRLWKNDYFGALVAGPTPELMRYELTVSGSKNVNLLVGNDLMINRTIEANSFETLLIGLAVDASKDWFISVRKQRRDRLISSEVPSAMNTQRSSVTHEPPPPLQHQSENNADK